MRQRAHGWHMALLAAGAMVALFLGLGLGWVLTIALFGCAAMLAVVFWIGRSSVAPPVVDPDRTGDSVDAGEHSPDSWGS